MLKDGPKLWSDDPLERALAKVIEHEKEIARLKNLCARHRRDEFDYAYALGEYTLEDVKRDYGFDSLDFEPTGECKECIKLAVKRRKREKIERLEKQPKMFSFPLFSQSEIAVTEEQRAAWAEWEEKEKQRERERRLLRNELIQQTFADVDPGFLPRQVYSSVELEEL